MTRARLYPEGCKRYTLCGPVREVKAAIDAAAARGLSLSQWITEQITKGLERAEEEK